MLAPGKKSYDKPTLPTKICIVKAMVFPIVKYECESWAIKKAELWKFDAFDLVLEKTLESSLESKIKPVNHKGNKPRIFIGRTDAEAPILWPSVANIAGRRTPFQGPKLCSCLTLGNELSEETHVLTKQEILLGKGTRVESSRVREPRRTALPRGPQSRVLWWWD